METRTDRVEPLLRELAPRVLGSIVRRFRDFAACEDAIQEALLAAATHWPREGVPDDPRAWLIRVAARRMTDHIRSEAARRRREEVTASLDDDAALAPDDDRAHERDDSLALLFMCCHPALTTSSAIALTLRAVGGLTSAEIARAFLVPEATMAQRISRAKQSIQESNVPFELPTPQESGQRLVAVMHVLYLIFSEGYTASSGSELQRVDLSAEAIRLARMLHSLLPQDSEVQGLLALMLLTDARRAARSGPAGELISLDQQDRGAWDRTAIAEGVALVSAALSKGSVGAYQLQAAIAAVHDEAASTAATDWAQILALYSLLQRMSDNPMVALNHAIATAMVRGPEAGLKAIDALASDPRLAGSHRLDAVRAHLLERAGQPGAAIEHYRRAAARTSSTPERNYLLTQAARLNDSS
ncbi:MAG TPA: sigma-70 family RNA polymerase sigma factor [Polyangiales bacterium]|nr:sigma-70 family RNA polymerase sigma factor [Polyangiales bacterium]